MTVKRILLSVFVMCIMCLQAQENGQYVVVVSLDGFRYDYPEIHKSPNLKKIAEKGVRVKRMIPSNPTKTFPNHYTLATGLHPSSHGLIHNNFYAPELDKTYQLGDRETVENGAFYGGEPLWVSAEKQGVKSASFFWVGSEAAVQGIYPSIWKRYNQDISFETRIDSVCQWLQKPMAERPRLIMFYYHEPDLAGHVYGPQSKEVGEQVRYTDEKIGALYEKLQALPIADSINLIVVSDHGMRFISEEKQLVLSDYLQEDWVTSVYGGNPFYMLKAAEGKKEQLEKALRKIPHAKVFSSSKVPARFEIAPHVRMGDFLIVGKKGWSILAEKDSTGYASKGTHGFLNTDKQMHGICIAVGPAFKKGRTKRKIRNVDLYPLVTQILGIVPAKVDGELKSVESLLRE